MIHLFQKNDLNRPTFLLLHGTGGDEHDLLPLASRIDPTYNVLSVRGEVKENGMNRFFRRLAEGVFDEEDVVYRTKTLIAFVKEASVTYGFDPAKVVALGYSNGANIAASVLLHDNSVFRKAILLHALRPLRITPPDLCGIDVFLSAGKTDRMILPELTQDLYRTLSQAKADVVLHWEEGGHGITLKEIEAAKSWLTEKTR